MLLWCTICLVVKHVVGIDESRRRDNDAAVVVLHFLVLFLIARGGVLDDRRLGGCRRWRRDDSE